jgi:fumarate reductase subunit C
VLAVAVHAPIGLRTILAEWLGWRGTALQVVTVFVALAIAVLGLRAVWAVIA